MGKIGMESGSSQSESTPLATGLGRPSVEAEEPERNTHLANNEDGEDDVFNSEKESEIESQEKRTVKIARKRTRKRITPGAGRRNVRFPCGVCSLGVGASGIICGACCLWIHGGKSKKCAGLSGKDENQADTFRCPKCIENDREINLKLRDELVFSKKYMARDCKSKEGNNSNNSINRTKRTLQDPSPKKDEMGNLSANKRQKVDTEHMQDYRSVIETQIFKMCIDFQEDYEATYDDPGVLNCWICGLACHGCRSHQKTQEMELYMISKGHIWLCYECKKEALILKKKNENWEGEVEHPPRERCRSYRRRWRRN